jgi:hypothetical protein
LIYQESLLSVDVISMTNACLEQVLQTGNLLDLHFSPLEIFKKVIRNLFLTIKRCKSILLSYKFAKYVGSMTLCQYKNEQLQAVATFSWISHIMSSLWSRPTKLAHSSSRNVRIWLAADSARRAIRRLSLVPGPCKAFSASTRDDRMSRCFSLYLLSWITPF